MINPEIPANKTLQVLNDAARHAYQWRSEMPGDEHRLRIAGNRWGGVDVGFSDGRTARTASEHPGDFDERASLYFLDHRGLVEGAMHFDGTPATPAAMAARAAITEWIR